MATRRRRLCDSTGTMPWAFPHSRSNDPAMMGEEEEVVEEGEEGMEVHLQGIMEVHQLTSGEGKGTRQQCCMQLDYIFSKPLVLY